MPPNDLDFLTGELPARNNGRGTAEDERPLDRDQEAVAVS